MLAHLIYKIRVFATIVALGIATSLLVFPDSLRSQAEEPCMFDDGSDEWICAEGPHLYGGHCEGNDCYSAMEFCCVTME